MVLYGVSTAPVRRANSNPNRPRAAHTRHSMVENRTVHIHEGQTVMRKLERFSKGIWFLIWKVTYTQTWPFDCVPSACSECSALQTHMPGTMSCVIVLQGGYDRINLCSNVSITLALSLFWNRKAYWGQQCLMWDKKAGQHT